MSSSTLAGGGGLPITDVAGDTDDPAVRARPVLRRKRRRRGSWAVARWWPLFLSIPAVVVLFHRAFKIGLVPEISEGGGEGAVGLNVKLAEVEAEEEAVPVGNLNRLEPQTRVVHGVSEPCLKLLSGEKIGQLEFPKVSKPFFIKRVLYESDEDNSHPHMDTSKPKQFVARETRFNLFTGNQTSVEREESFKVKETVMLHCGFYSANGGFRISEEDRNYMETCYAVVSTCAFGGGDDLYQPIGMVEKSLSKVCFVAFWDEITLLSQEASGVRVGEHGMVGKWRIVVVRNLPFSDQRLNGKIPKMLSHRLFPRARYSIWVDSKSQFRRDPIGVLEALLWRANSVFAISEHGRGNIYAEGVAVIKKHKATPEEVYVQLEQYRRDKHPEDKTFRGKKALAEASVIVREHIPLTDLFMCLWFNEVVRFTSRDQLSFPYVLRRLGILNINMFSVCIRKDLVNSMGHKRKSFGSGYRFGCSGLDLWPGLWPLICCHSGFSSHILKTDFGAWKGVKETKPSKQYI